MYARQVDEASARLRELRHQQRQQLGLGGLALVLAVVATYDRPTLALPLMLGGLAVGALGVRALWRRWDLVDRLAGERDAHVISEVRAYASREATMERRSTFATLIRSRLDASIGPAAAELEQLASELENAELALDPAAAVACMWLLSDPALPPEELRSRARQVRSGFSPLRIAA